MAMPARWTRGLRPNQSVLDLIEDLSAAALKGEIRTIAVGIVKVDLTTESKEAGELDHPRAMLLAATLTKAAQQILLNNP